MLATASRSASRATLHAEAVATGPLGTLSHDELGVIFDGLADPLAPAVASALRGRLDDILERAEERELRNFSEASKWRRWMLPGARLKTYPLILIGPWR